jgi:cyclomaltodextrinase
MATEQHPAPETTEFVPEWAKSVVWYQIFPERFRNGDPSNDPTVQSILGADPQEPPKTWQVHPWGSDWYKLQEYERQNGEPELWKHLIRRRYGGDLQGIIDKLGYLEDLGVNALYLNPVFDSPSHHKYDGSSYHHIDPDFGPDPVGDRELMQQENPLEFDSWVWTSADELALELIRKAHSRGMRIIFDGVFNHMGVNAFAFRDLKAKQHASPYRDWFSVLSWDDADASSVFDYEGWWGIKSLPELRKQGSTLADAPKRYVFAATERWLNPKGLGIEHGIDGWRLDVAYCVPHGFWKEWRRHVKSINPQAYLTSELILPVEETKPYFEGDEFDGEMNYNFAYACSEFLFSSPPESISATEFDHKLRALRESYPKGVAEASQNLFGSHDSNRIASHIVNRGIGRYRDGMIYFNLSKHDNPDYQLRKPDASEIALQKLFVIMQMTYMGAPMVYYGDEVGMWGANDPDCRKPMIWDDISFEDEATLPDQSTRIPDPVEINYDLYAHYKKLIAIRRNHKALLQGTYSTLLADDANGIFGFERRYGDQTVWVFLNRSAQPQAIRVPCQPGCVFEDLLNEQSLYPESGVLEFSLKPYWGAIFRLDR